MKIINTLNDIPYDRSVAIYGAGNAGTRVLSLLGHYRPDLEVCCFVDSYKEGQLEELPIHAFAQFVDLADRPELILITSIFWREIEAALCEKGLQEYLVVPPRFYSPKSLELIKRVDIPPLGNPLAGEFFSFQPEDCRVWANSLEKVEKILQRQQDRDLFRLITGGPNGNGTNMAGLTWRYYQNRPGRQYFEHIDFASIHTVIDGGAYDGETSLEFYRAMPEPDSVFAFEPNLKLLQQGGLFDELDNNDSIFIEPFGLWREKDQLSFVDDGSSSSISNVNCVQTEAIIIDVISIDQFVAEKEIKKVDLIKMDIEGAELEALQGALTCLKRDRPQLAICLYHRLEHLFKIPLLLDDVLTDYCYYLENYQDDLTEIVLYAIPRELCT